MFFTLLDKTIENNAENDYSKVRMEFVSQKEFLTEFHNFSQTFDRYYSVVCAPSILSGDLCGPLRLTAMKARMLLIIYLSFHYSVIY